MLSSRVRTSFPTVATCLALLSPAFAQFDSGSSGADGALNVTSNTSIPVQEDGIHEYTTINVANGATLTFTRNSLNTPVILLAQGEVTIAGTINLNGEAGRGVGDPLAGAPGSEAIPGPGGYLGGVGAVPVFKGGSGIGTSGGGPGGGAAANDPSGSPTNGYGRAGNGGSHFTAGAKAADNPNQPAPTYGDIDLLTLTGGSGGAGGNFISSTDSVYDGPGGGAGGGGILIASSTSIIVSGTIQADGGAGQGGFGGAAAGTTNGSGGGAGGSIRLIANAVSGDGRLYTRAGGGASPGGVGRIHIEGFSVTGNIINNSQPAPGVTHPGPVKLPDANIPTIQILTIGGQTVPTPPTGSTTVPDVTIPASTPNPVTIEIATTNIPDGAIIHLRITLSSGDIVAADSAPVSGNATTASANLANNTIGVIYATAEFNP